MHILTLIVAVIVTINLSLCETCLDEYLKGTGVEGRFQNRFKSSDQPIFYLNFDQTSLKTSDVYLREYKVYVSSRDPSKLIKEVKIVTISDPQCGEGEFTFSKKNFYQNRTSCGKVFSTKKQNFLVKSPTLRWSPPYCSCVKFRVIVVSDNIYYTDDEVVQNGPLSQRVCIKKQVSKLSYINALCHVTESSSVSASNVITSQYFLKRYKLDVNMVNRVELEETLETRLGQIRNCCTSLSTITCLFGIRRQRMDKFCNRNITDLPIVNFKVKFNLEKQVKCCYYGGRKKSRCFAYESEFSHTTNETVLDFSYDNNDPLNDLAIFGSVQDKDLLKNLTFVEFHQKTSTTDQYNDPYIIGTNKMNHGGDTKKQDETKKMQEDRQLIKMCCKEGQQFGYIFPGETRYKSTAGVECGEGLKTFVSQNLISDTFVCAHHYATCCLYKFCCRAGMDYSSGVRSIDANVVSAACKRGTSEYLRRQNLTSHRKVCEVNFSSCCIKQAFIANTNI